jgi:hypothetical protein
LINVIVRDGVVELWGTILDERKRQALWVVAENFPGTRQVKDHLSVEPMSGMVFEAPDQGMDQLPAWLTNSYVPVHAFHRASLSRLSVVRISFANTDDIHESDASEEQECNGDLIEHVWQQDRQGSKSRCRVPN